MNDRPPALVFGGTFDPPHRIHQTMASAAADALNARTILVIPAAVNPQRTASPPAPAQDRLAMLALAFRREPRAQILDLEITRGGPSYSIDTLEALHRRGEAPLRCLIGGDQALNLPTWRRWQDVIRLAPPAIVPRPPFDQALTIRMVRDRLAESDPSLRDMLANAVPSWVLAIPPVDISSTAIRAELAREHPADALDPDVWAYIQGRGLYRQR